jgi:hypothetical protein
MNEYPQGSGEAKHRQGCGEAHVHREVGELAR